MEIVHYKVPVSLVRTNSGNVELKMHEDQRTEIKREPSNIGSTEIANLAKSLSDDNEMQKEIIKKSLLRSEQKRESFITMKMIVN